MNTQPILTLENLKADIAAIEAIIKRYEPALAQGTHLVTGTGALRTAIRCLKDHVQALAAAPAKPAEVPK
jgi:hypothetical protein